jgi:thioredoxin-related protein
MTFLLLTRIAALALTLASVPLPAIAAELRDPNAFFALNMGDLQSEVAEARSTGRQALLVVFEQEGCPGCAHMRGNVLPHAEVQDYYRKHFVALSVDIYGSVPLKDAAGRDTTEKGYSQAIKVRATPTFIFYDLSGAEIVRYVGPLERPEEFILLGQFVATGAYKKGTFAQYRTQKLKGG